MRLTGLPEAYFAGLFISFSLMVAIGAQNAFVLRQGITGVHVALVVTVCVLLDVILMAAGVGGVAASLNHRPYALEGVALAGACFLGWYGFGAARRAWLGQSLLRPSGCIAQSARRTLLQTLAVSLLNPHVYLDTVVLVGSVGAQQPSALRPAFLVGACTASLGWFATIGFGARILAPIFTRPEAWRALDALVALIMWTVAMTLVLKAF